MQLFWDYLGKIAPQAQLSAKPAKSFKAAPIPPIEHYFYLFIILGKTKKYIGKICWNLPNKSTEKPFP